MKKINFSPALFFLILFSLGLHTTSNAQDVIMKSFDKKPPYPPSFDSGKTNILVALYDKESEVTLHDYKPGLKSISKDEQKEFPLLYTGDYTFATIGTDIEDESYFVKDSGEIYKYKITNPAYADVSKYRYVLFSRCKQNFIDNGQVLMTDYHLGIYDRQE